MVETVFQKVDSNNSGKISYTEFLVAATQEQQLVSKQKVELTFKMFDKVEQWELRLGWERSDNSERDTRHNVRSGFRFDRVEKDYPRV